MKIKLHKMYSKKNRERMAPWHTVHIIRSKFSCDQQIKASDLRFLCGIPTEVGRLKVRPLTTYKRMLKSFRTTVNKDSQQEIMSP
jgi:hypothetical protein